jgi:class 3 adenylate cyclase/tetratricopeptide (TPR) repeat protein
MSTPTKTALILGTVLLPFQTEELSHLAGAASTQAAALDTAAAQGYAPLDMSCQRCGFESPAGFRFCGACGQSLATVEPGRQEVERKVVTALFCDVVESTERAERLDPEDVRAVLAPYYAGVREHLQRKGGTVEKFIGDAVCGLFGAPRTYGDDPERAVRAGLAIRDWVAEVNEADPRLELHIRLGVATGDAVVALGARSSEGEAMAWGDVMNTAARLQSAAPVDSILVDERTYRATRHVIEYGEAGPVKAKGKAEPVLVWQALAPRARRGIGLSPESRSPFVGRAAEFLLLRQILDRVARQRSPELIALLGETGIGKSRLVLQLARWIDAEPNLFIRWRQAGASPYGDVLTYWALGEIVKAQAGILETDGASVARSKLGRAVVDVVPSPDEAARVEAHLLSLVGLRAATVAHGDQRQAAFAAWRRFLEAVARQRTLVLVFEDVHWSDSGVLDFIEHLLDWARDAGILIICTGRPEFVELRPDWWRKNNATRVDLAPLSNEEIDTLVAQLAPSSVPRETREAIVGSASGNPLFAVEFVRMLVDRVSQPPSAESIQAIIAARLDALSNEEKLLLQDAAVVGRVVWPGALARIGGRSRRFVDHHLGELVRKEFLIRVSPSSVHGETEFRFRHVLVRDVAYEQIPRVRRAEIHRRTAEWLESLSPDRTAERAEMLAFHYVEAYEYALAAYSDTDALAESARIALRDAGDRALTLNAFAAAERHYAAALGLCPDDDPGRPTLLLRLGTVRYYADAEGDDVLRDAERLLLEAGDPESAAEAAALLANLADMRGEPHETVFEHAHRALALVEGLGASRSRIEVLLDLAVFLSLASEQERAIALAEGALRDAEALALPELEARALATMGMSRAQYGDVEGRADLERSIAITEEIDSPLASHHCGMLADLEGSYGNLAECFELQARARGHALRFGHVGHIEWLKAELVAECYWTGRWDEGLSIADQFLADAEAGSGHFMEGYCRDNRARIRLARGEFDGALDDSTRALDQARASNQPQMLCPALAVRARVLASAGALDEAGQMVDELLALWANKLNLFPISSWVLDLAYTLQVLGRADELRTAAEGVLGRTTWLDAASAFATGDYESATDLLARIGSRPDEALVRLRSAQAAAGAGRDADARRELERVLAFFGEVQANGYLRDAEALVVA